MYGLDWEGNDPAIFPGRRIDKNEFQKLQDYFCETAGVYAYCLDGGRNRVTDMSGEPEAAEKLTALAGPGRIDAIYSRVAESPLEDQAVEETDCPYLRLAAVSVKAERQPVLTWIVFGIITDACGEQEGQEPPENFRYSIGEERFHQSLDLLREAVRVMIQTGFEAQTAEAESRRKQLTLQEMSASFSRKEAVTQVTRLLDSDAPAEDAAREALRIQGTYLDLSSACLFCVKPGADQMDVIAQWQTKGRLPDYVSVKGQPIFRFLGSEKPVVVSSDTLLNSGEKEELAEMSVRAFIAMPVSVNGIKSCYACYFEKAKERVWQIEEVKFINETVRIVQSILNKKAQSRATDDFLALLNPLLQCSASYVYVRDKESGELQYVSPQVREEFAGELADGSFLSLFEDNRRLECGGGEYEVCLEDGKSWYRFRYADIEWLDKKPALIGAFNDITEKKNYQKQFEQQAYTDFLTGMYNRMCCEKDLAAHIQKTEEKGGTGALLYLDLDDFKHINDGLGHQYGDVLLKAISHSLRRVDGIQNTCYRMGGDEFVIIIPPESYPAFEIIIEQIKAIFAKPWFLKDADYYCTMSMGIVEFPEEGKSVSDLIKKADIAMYAAKKDGKNRITKYSEDINTASGRRLDMEKNMRDATVAGYQEFDVYFQPIIDIQSPGLPCTGAEALIRWNNASMGFIPPTEFIPLAEYLGLINPIGNYVLKEACRYCRQWNDDGHPGYKVNVNLSVVQLLQPDIVNMVETALHESRLSPRNLTLEVTESLAINDMERMKEILGSIKKLGVRIALDDFGTGYSSLNHIREIPFDVIKVDQSFVKDLATDAYSQSFIRMVAELADAIHVSICVEGIETREQYKVLEDMKVRLVQGYYFDKPMKREEFEAKYVKPAHKPEHTGRKRQTPKRAKASSAVKQGTGDSTVGPE